MHNNILIRKSEGKGPLGESRMILKWIIDRIG
jgi:hypothetical protein